MYKYCMFICDFQLASRLIILYIGRIGVSIFYIIIKAKINFMH